MIFLLAWVLLSFTNAIKYIMVKHTLKWVNSTLLVGIISMFTTIILLPFVVAEGIPELSSKFFYVFVAGWTLYSIWKIFFFKSIQQWDISFIAPLKWLVTINVVFTSWLLLGEVPSMVWMLWILLIVSWVYLLAIQKNQIGWFAPIKHIYTDRWSRLYLVTALCYGFTVTIDKIWVLETSPIFWVFAMNLFLTVASSTQVIKRRWELKNIISNNLVILTAIIILSIVIVVGQMYIIEQILASYTSAFKSSSALFAVLIGWFIFKEKDLKQKFWAALVIFAGVICIVLS